MLGTKLRRKPKGGQNPSGMQRETQNPNNNSRNLQLHDDTQRKLSTMVSKGAYS